MSVILATWEAEIKRIIVQGQPGKQISIPHLQNNQSKMDWRYGSSACFASTKFTPNKQTKLN
jgi:hypothetical protein